MKLLVKQKELARAMCLCLIGLLIRACYIFLTKEILYPLSYGVSHPHYDISYSLSKDVITGVVFFVESLILFILKKTVFFDNLLNMLYVIYFIPLNAISSLVDARVDFIILSNVFIFEIILCFSISGSKKGNSPVSDIDKYYVFDDKRIRSLCLTICLLFIAFKVSINGFDFSLGFLNAEIYANRMATVELLRANDVSLMGRISNVLLDISIYIAPVYLFVSIKQKKWIEAIVATLTIIAQFSLFSMKGTLLIIPIVVFFALYKDKRNFTRLLYGGALSAFGFLAIIWVFFEKSMLYFIVVRRLLFIPTWLNTIYYDFFSTNPKLFLSDEVFLVKHFVPKAYNNSIMSIINNRYFDGAVASPNNGLFSEGYMQFGVIGLLLYPLVYKVMLDWVERTYKSFSKQFNLVICSIVAINLPNVGMFRSDFVMSFFLMTIVIQIVQRLKVNK